ncbi:MAG: hypothetical protein DMG96_14010 [Acidobacteria bacterium]|nr:MAG: hypothetical protein DMG96_14010 [Acidobacteriota bacterium]
MLYPVELRGRSSSKRMVRPERFELPTFWFVAVAARKISNLHSKGDRSTELDSLANSQASASVYTCQCNSIRVGTGHKIRHRESALSEKEFFLWDGTHAPFSPRFRKWDSDGNAFGFLRTLEV